MITSLSDSFLQFKTLIVSRSIELLNSPVTGPEKLVRDFVNIPSNFALEIIRESDVMIPICPFHVSLQYSFM